MLRRRCSDSYPLSLHLPNICVIAGGTNTEIHKTVQIISLSSQEPTFLFYHCTILTLASVVQIRRAKTRIRAEMATFHPWGLCGHEITRQRPHCSTDLLHTQQRWAVFVQNLLRSACHRLIWSWDQWQTMRPNLASIFLKWYKHLLVFTWSTATAHHNLTQHVSRNI